MMQWVICTKGREQSGQDLTGPFETYEDAEAVFIRMGPASDYSYKYIIEMFTSFERDIVEIMRCIAEWEGRGWVCQLFFGNLADQELGAEFGGCQVNGVGGFVYGRPK